MLQTLSKRVAHPLCHHMALWLVAVRDGFVVLLPLTMLGVLATVLLNLPWEAYQHGMNAWLGTEWKHLPLQLHAASKDILGLALAAAISIRLGLSLHQKPLKQSNVMLLGSISVVSFIALAAPLSGSFEQALGHQSLLQAIIVGLCSAEIFIWLKRSLPRSSAAAGLDGSQLLKDAIAGILPFLLGSTLTVLIVMGIQCAGLFILNGVAPITHAWLAAFDNVQWLNLLAVIANQLLWLVGLHGGNLIEAHAGAFIAPADILFDPQRASIAFINTFAYLGGCGATGGLVLALYLHSKERSLRRLAGLSVVPALVNVNEIIVYGLPIVFNPIFVLPFLLAPLATTSIALVAKSLGWFELAGQAVSWSTPIFLSGYLLTNSWQGAFVQLLGLLASTAIYWPFVLKLERSRRQTQARALSSALNVLATPANTINKTLARTDTVGDFARALHADFLHDLGSGRVFQVYQPKHDQAGKLCGVEALLRWDHAVHGMIRPDSIINIAEETQLIHKIGEWALHQACANLAQWKSTGISQLVMSVNVSPLQLENTAWADTVKACLEKYGLEPKELDLEITEGRSIANTPESEATLHRLVDLDIHLSMDDFGMGYTSLLYMQRFKMYSIKIDGTLTREVLHNNVCTNIIRAIVELGNQQGVRVVAEFVESEAQQEMLAALGCHEFQGYLYSQPLTAENTLAYLKDRQ